LVPRARERILLGMTPPASRRPRSRSRGPFALGGLAVAVGVGVGGWLAGCTSFSGESDVAPAGPDGSPDDGAPPLDTGAAPLDGAALADGGSRGCAEIDATVCFDFDHVATASLGWSSISPTLASEPTLSSVAFSAPFSARFELPPTAGVMRPQSLLTNAAGPPPVAAQARVRVEQGSAAESATILVYDLRSGGNAMNVAYSCAAGSQTCSSSMTVYTKASVTSAQLKTTFGCGTFVRDAWAPVTVLIAPDPTGTDVTCSVGPAAQPSQRVGVLGPATNPIWQLGLSDDNPVGSFGGQVVSFDDVAFR
jgi:hypothetical protein